jgi:hypothetical protein
MVSRDERLGGEGSVELVTAAMRRLPQCLEVQSFGCVAVGQLAKQEGNGPRLREHRAWEVTMAAMRLFPNDPKLQARACNAIACLVAGDKEMRAALSEARALILEATKAFPADDLLQRLAARALSSLSGHQVRCWGVRP